MEPLPIRVARVETDLTNVKSRIEDTNIRVETVNSGLESFKVRTLVSIVSILLATLSGIFVGYITHFLH